MNLLTSKTDPEEVDFIRQSASLSLKILRKRLLKLDSETDPLQWCPTQADLSILFAALKMYYAIPASSADCERSFSSASFTLDIHRYQIDPETFRKEHRLRRFLVSGTDSHSAEGRQERLRRLNLLLDWYDEILSKEIPVENVNNA